MSKFYNELESIEKGIIVVIILLMAMVGFAVASDGELYQECIDSGLHDKFECRDLIYGD